MIKQLFVERLLDFLKEDAYPEDVTSRIVSGINARGIAFSKDSGVLSGNYFLVPFLDYLGFKVEQYKRDGESVSYKDVLLVFQGKADELLSVERLTLNLLGKLSGITTATATMVRLAREVNPSVKIAGTRKTTPGLRLFEKYAIEVGGGDPHRFNLADAVLIKDNHLALLGSIEEAVRRAKAISFTKKVEVEVSSYEDALRAYKAGADAILVDNLKPDEIVPIVNELKGKLIIEASGRITPENVKDYARTGVDVISSGYITHSARSLDFSMDVERA
ncbi:MAG: nicotinate-nucleotide pyrophosphorylase [Candidatus Aramenus sulfurataquae]|uniref:Carboxylating nicotinate-nucleotide diphosphorylase n=4 Tax=Candidatus Aramenus sulfurataquae TaxID=1326980 RepID=A0ACC6TQV9_9CREN|nr:MAG: nicotinate-nucleotide pyrophosphorylase [Candidatus Aramenus sulfurataquae]